MAYFIARMVHEAYLISLEDGQAKYRAFMAKPLCRGYKIEVDNFLRSAPFNCPECIVDVE